MRCKFRLDNKPIEVKDGSQPIKIMLGLVGLGLLGIIAFASWEIMIFIKSIG